MEETQISVVNPVFESVCSIVPKDRKEAAKLFNAVNNPEHRIGDFINKKIAIKDILIEPVEMLDEKTGEMKLQPRVVVIDKDGKAYQAVSIGIYNAVMNLGKCYGAPSWEDPIVCTVKQIPTKNGSMLTLVTE